MAAHRVRQDPSSLVRPHRPLVGASLRALSPPLAWLGLLGCQGPPSGAPALVTASVEVPVVRRATPALPGRLLRPDPFAFDARLFERKPPAQPGEWRYRHREPEQTFPSYLGSIPQGTTARRRVIVIQPLGTFSRAELALIEEMRGFAEAFFQGPARVEKPLPLPAAGTRTGRIDGREVTQHLTQTLLYDLLLPRLPVDAVAYLGITAADLYPGSGWRFAFGMASFQQRVGVYSLARIGQWHLDTRRLAAYRPPLRRRAFKILAHETTHMFSIPHCGTYECLMNGSNSLTELDRNTVHLCPECLRKLCWNLDLSVPAHYRAVRYVFRRHGFEDWVRWIDRRLEALE